MTHKATLARLLVYSLTSLALVSITSCIILYILNTAPSISNKRMIHLRSGVVDTSLKASMGKPTTLTASIINSITNLLDTETKRADMNVIKSFLLHLCDDHYHHALDSEIRNSFERSLTGLGIQLGRYIPHNTYMVTGTKAQMEEAQHKHSEIILWYGELEAKDKVQSIEQLKGYLKKHVTVEAMQQQSKPGQRVLLSDDKGANVHFTVIASVAEHQSKEQLKQRLSLWTEQLRNEHNLNIVSSIAVNTEKIAIGVQGAEHALHTTQWLTGRGHVHWVEVKPPTITHNKYAAMLTQSYSKPYSHPMWDRGINGANQIIGVGDTGVDYYHCFFYDDQNPTPPITRLIREDSSAKHRKFAAFWSYMDSVDSAQGHGTHVSGTASGQAHSTLSSPGLSDYNSPAFGSKLAFADCGCDTDGGCTCPSDTQCECDLKVDQKCQKRFGVVYLPLDLSSDYFSWFYGKGARVMSNSWGTGYYRDFSFGYSTTTSEIDKFVWNNKDFLPLFAAGNSGGQYGYASLTSESESKNGLSIGASQSCLESFTDAANLTDYKQIIDTIKVQLYQYYCVDSLAGSIDSADPTKAAMCEAAKSFNSVTDCCNDGGACKGAPDSKCCGSQKFNDAFPNIGFRCCPTCIDLEMINQPTHFSSNNLALFTARGPALDGRIKPDLVTVGDKIMSSLSQGTNPANKCMPQLTTSSQLLKHEGTSMACPVAASNAILVRQFYTDGYYGNNKPVPSQGFSPSAALIKATLIHSTRVLDGLIYLMSKHVWWPLQYKEGHRFQLRQSYHQGFGRIELNNVLSPTSNLYVPSAPGPDPQIMTNVQDGYCVSMKQQGLFKATLVWSDFPSTPSAQINLVNNLDLIVVMPDGTRYYGNGKYSPVNSARDEADYLNNIEQFSMDNAPSGQYNVIVRGFSVPHGPQPYALVISGNGISKSSNCFPFDVNLTPELTTFKNYAYTFGIICLVAIPTLALISIYFYLQYREVTTMRGGYKMSAMAQTSSGHQLITDHDHLELETLRKEMPEESIFDDDDEEDDGLNHPLGSTAARAGLVMRERSPIQ